jgi:hypothetical protein
MKRYPIPLLFISMMAFAMMLQAQESSQPMTRKEPPKAEDTRKFPDSFFDEKRQLPDSLPEDQRQLPGSVSNEKRLEPNEKQQFPDSFFNEKQRSP